MLDGCCAAEQLQVCMYVCMDKSRWGHALAALGQRLKCDELEMKEDDEGRVRSSNNLRSSIRTLSLTNLLLSMSLALCSVCICRRTNKQAVHYIYIPPTLLGLSHPARRPFPSFSVSRIPVRSPATLGSHGPGPSLGCLTYVNRINLSDWLTTFCEHPSTSCSRPDSKLVLTVPVGLPFKDHKHTYPSPELHMPHLLA